MPQVKGGRRTSTRNLGSSAEALSPRSNRARFALAFRSIAVPQRSRSRDDSCVCSVFRVILEVSIEGVALLCRGLYGGDSDSESYYQVGQKTANKL